MYYSVYARTPDGTTPDYVHTFDDHRDAMAELIDWYDCEASGVYVIEAHADPNKYIEFGR